MMIFKRGFRYENMAMKIYVLSYDNKILYKNCLGFNYSTGIVQPYFFIYCVHKSNPGQFYNLADLLYYNCNKGIGFDVINKTRRDPSLYNMVTTPVSRGVIKETTGPKTLFWNFNMTNVNMIKKYYLPLHKTSSIYDIGNHQQTGSVVDG